MQQFNAIDGQSLLDVCLNTYGSLDYFFKMVQDNGVLNADAQVVSGQQFVWDDSLVQNQQINAAFAASGIFYATEIGASQAVAGFGILTEDGLFIVSENQNNLIQE